MHCMAIVVIKKAMLKQLKIFDLRLPELMNHLREDDLVIITADHGNDPIAKGTDHTREYIPLLMFSQKLKIIMNFHKTRHLALSVLQ